MSASTLAPWFQGSQPEVSQLLDLPRYGYLEPRVPCCSDAPPRQLRASVDRASLLKKPPANRIAFSRAGVLGRLGRRAGKPRQSVFFNTLGPSAPTSATPGAACSPALLRSSGAAPLAGFVLSARPGFSLGRGGDGLPAPSHFRRPHRGRDSGLHVPTCPRSDRDVHPYVRGAWRRQCAGCSLVPGSCFSGLWLLSPTWL